MFTVAVAHQPVGAMYRLAGHTFSPEGVAALGLALALAGLIPSRAWRVGRLAITAVHECGHAAVAILIGRKVSAVHLRADGSGVTFHRGSLSWRGRLVTTAAGYPAPAVVGVAGAWLTANHHARLWLAVLGALGAAMAVLWVRNLFGLALMAAWVAGLGWLAASGTRGGDALVGAAAAWYLALGGLRAAAELFRDHGPSDAADLARLVRLPPSFWKATFSVIAGGAVALCAMVLLALR